MPKLNEISINVGVTITEDTMQRCLALLSMWLEDNPDKTLKVFEWHYGDRVKRTLEVAEEGGAE